MNDSGFSTIIRRAEQRKGGSDALASLLLKPATEDELIARPDRGYLAEMTRGIFQAGFVWRVINNKWPGFCEAFHDFDPNRLMKLSDVDWDSYLDDRRIVRNRQKIRALQHNLWFVHELSQQHDGFGRFLAEWPKQDLVGLFTLLKRKGSRLGGNTGQYFLQRVGMDSFALTRDVVTAIQSAGLDIADNPTSKQDLDRIQRQFNEWHAESGYGFLQMSHILAYSVGENRVFADSA